MVLQGTPSLGVPREGPPGSTQRASWAGWHFVWVPKRKKEADDGTEREEYDESIPG